MTNGFGKRLVVRLLLTILLTFTVLGTLGSGYAGYLLSSPKVCLSQVEKQQAAAKIHDSVESYFTAQYQTTAIPAETYLNVVTEDWIAERLEEQITSEYQILNGAKLSYQLDMSDLEAALTQFFSDYAEEINYIKDSTYEQKLQETIDNAEAELTSQLDVYHFSTMRNANILSRLIGKQLYLWIACGVCGVVSLLLMGILMGLERNGEWGMLYFPGCALFINGVFLILPTAWVLATSYFSGLAIKVPAVYAAVTGVLYHCTRVGLVAGIVLAVLGLAAIVGSTIGRRKAAR